MMSCAVYSMTGFAAMQGVAADGTEFQLTVKGVNHRFLDLALRLPSGCEGMEAGLRAAVKGAVRRGHVDVTCTVSRGEAGGAVQLNRELLASYVGVYRTAAAEFGARGEFDEFDLGAMLRLPGVVRTEGGAAAGDTAGLEAAVMEVLPEVLARLNEARAAEGAALAAELRAAAGRCEGLRAEVAALRVGARATYAERLRVRVAELLAGAAVSEERIAAEAALLAERSDVDEELVRLGTHLKRFIEMLDAGGEVGKRLDFLLQELNREANTLLSKTGGTGSGMRVTELGLELKHDLEKMREQVQNLE